MLSQDFIRSKAWRRNSLLYRCPFFRSTLRLLSRKVCTTKLSHSRGSLQRFLRQRAQSTLWSDKGMHHTFVRGRARGHTVSRTAAAPGGSAPFRASTLLIRTARLLFAALACQTESLIRAIIPSRNDANKTIYYNEWAELSRNDFKPVVAAFKQLRRQFCCEKTKCDSWLSPTPKSDPVDLRCACGTFRLNLKEK
jgi:hypothetical protein